MGKAFLIDVLLILVFIIVGCQSRKKSMGNRHYYGFRTRYNSYYHAQESFNKALKDSSFTFEETILRCRKTIERYSLREREVEQNPFIVQCWLLMGKAYYYNKEYEEAIQVFSYIRLHFRETKKVTQETYLWEIKSLLATGDTLQASFLLGVVNIQQLSRKNRKEFTQLTALLAGNNKKDSFTADRFYLPGTNWNRKAKSKLLSEDLYTQAKEFTTDECCSTLLFIYPAGIQTDESLLYSLLSFNFTYLYIKTLQVEIRTMEDLQIGVVAGFSGQKEIEQYLTLLYTYASPAMHALTDIIPVSYSNYQLIRTKEDLSAYLTFYLSKEICNLLHENTNYIYFHEKIPVSFSYSVYTSQPICPGWFRHY